MNNLIDIRILCNQLGVTSRTLRFYEDEGLIKSSTVPGCNRRQYSKEQIEEVKAILILRSVGMSVSKMIELQKEVNNLSCVIGDYKSQIDDAIISKVKELNLLDEALENIKSGKDIFKVAIKDAPKGSLHEQQMLIVEQCTNAFVIEDYATCYELFSSALKQHMPLTAMAANSHNTVKSLGRFLKIEKVARGSVNKDTYLAYLKYRNLGVLIKYVFIGNELHGMWLNYYQGV